ncbi:MAG: zinc-ribbon and DUF3426 domain-containing protein [bacterium]
MFAQCPACQTIYKVNSVDLAQMGLAHCGACGAIIQLTEVLKDNVPGLDAEPEKAIENKDDIEQVDDLLEAQSEPLNFGEQPDFEIEVDDKIELDESDPPLEKFIKEPEFIAPELVDKPEQKASKLVVAGIVIASIAFVLQLGWVFRSQLMKSSGFGPIMKVICPQALCTLEYERQVDKIRLVNRDIRKHPSVDGALIISATIINDAKQPQPYPQVEIQLWDIQSQVVAMRRFSPAEYLDKNYNTQALMQPGVLVPISFETVDPGDNAISFEFKFH